MNIKVESTKYSHIHLCIKRMYDVHKRDDDNDDNNNSSNNNNVWRIHHKTTA
jgi:hypothetical protein